MKRLVLLTAVLAAMCVATSQAVVIYDNPNGGAANGWNWGTTICNHTAAEVDLGDGNIVIRHTGVVNNTTGAAADARFGSKWDLTVSGNTSVDPADYTISFDVRNVSGNWDPYPLQLAILTKENPDQGHGYATVNLAQADGWVHVEFNLADWSNNWHEGAEWDLTNPNWSLEVGGPGWPGTSYPDGTSFTQVWEMDNLKIIMGSDTAPYEPQPADGEPQAGTVINLTQANVTLGWNGGGDPNIVTDYPVDPAILGYYVYHSNGDDDVLEMKDYVLQDHDDDPYLTDPYNEYGPLALTRGATYYWQIEQAYENPDNPGNPYSAGDPNNMSGPVWSFTVIPALATVSAVSPAYNAVSAGSDLVLTVTGNAIEIHQWYKIGDPDVALTNGADYDGVDTGTLTIYNVQVADEGYYYCRVENSLPSVADNKESGPARVMTQRLMSHYPMESMDYGVNPLGITPDVVSGFDMRMASNDTGTDVPVLAAITVPGLAGVSSLQFDNPPGSDDPNNVYAQYAQIDEGMLVAYQDITISAWVYSNGGSAWNRIVDFGNNNGNYIDMATNWWGNPGRLGCEIMVGGVGQSIVSPEGAIPNNEWTLVTATLSGDTGRLYVNGELVATNTSMTHNPISFAPTTQNWLARSQWGPGDGYFDGMIDDLKIYNYGLTAQEIGYAYLMVTGEPWVCDWAAWGQDALMTALDVNDDCKIDLVDFAAFAGKWLEDAYQISLP
jgi:hypothetical protein